MRLRKHNRAADSDRENCVRSQGAYFEGDWGVIVLCTVFPVSSMNVSIFHITWLDTFWTGLVDCDMITTIRLVNTPLLTVSVACAWWELFRSVLSASFRYTEWYYWLCPPSCVLDPGFTAGSFCPLTTSTRFPFTRFWQPSICFLFLWVFFFFFFLRFHMEVRSYTMMSDLFHFRDALMVHPRCYKWQDLLLRFYWWIAFHCVYTEVPHFLHPLTHRWTRRLVLCLGCCTQCCRGHGSADLSLRSWVHFLGIHTQECNCWIIW